MSLSYALPFICQHLWPSSAHFTEADLHSLHKKVILITGSSSGIGAELARQLYTADATVYLAARSLPKLEAARSSIQTAVPDSKGRLELLQLDLSDLASIKASAQDFLRRESHLHVLYHNAGVMAPAKDSKDKQGHDLEMGTNCLGPWLFTQLLIDTMKKTIEDLRTQGLSEHDAAGRIIFTTSSAILTAQPGGVAFDGPEPKAAPTIMAHAMDNYAQSKTGDVLLAFEVARRYGQDGIISASIDPGFIKSELQREWSPLYRNLAFATGWFKDVKYGAWTELFAGFSSKITLGENNGGIVVPWGQVGHLPGKVQHAVDDGVAERFWGWCEGECARYL